MKLEYLAEGSRDCPLLRLYGFDLSDAQRLREAFRTLATGARKELSLHEEWWIHPVEDCRLELHTGVRDLGVVERAPLLFDCVLTREGWQEMTEKVDPFCRSEDGDGFQWLNHDGEVSLLLSPNGQW